MKKIRLIGIAICIITIGIFFAGCNNDSEQLNKLQDKIQSIEDKNKENNNDNNKDVQQNYYKQENNYINQEPYINTQNYYPQQQVIDSSKYFFMIPDSSTRYLTEYELKYYTTHELAIARNEIYAIHGYVFVTDEWKNYFANQQWYVPISQDVTLNSIEEYNVNLIKNEESRR